MNFDESLEHLFAQLAARQRAMEDDMAQRVPGFERGFLDGMSPTSPGTPVGMLSTLADAAGLTLPSSAAGLLAEWELGFLSVGGITFCGAPTLFEYLQQQLCNSKLAWGRHTPLSGHVVIAASPAYLVVLSLVDSSVSAFGVDAASETRVLVAPSLELFLKVLASLSLQGPAKDPQEFAAQVCELFGTPAARVFWTHRAIGAA